MAGRGGHLQRGQLVSSKSMFSAEAVALNSSSKRDFPMPASADTNTSRPIPETRTFRQAA